MTPTRRYPIGAELVPGGGAHVRVWAPASKGVSVEILGAAGTSPTLHPLDPEPGGYFSGLVSSLGAGSLYRFQLSTGAFADPASRFQPEGPHGPSMIVDPAFDWTDQKWRGRKPHELVLYELHLGTFTPKGTWRAAMEQLPELAKIGITALEVMPVAEFPGRFGWGYDGVDLFAPTRLYGTPSDARAFINRAHELEMMVLLDVVYNHLGPDGCFLREFSPDYFSHRYKCEWGEPLNFDGENAAAVREYFMANARYWIEEYHFDGLRLDATQQIFDASPRHIVAEIAAAVRQAAPHRRTFIVAENEPQQAILLQSPEVGGYGLDAVWNDDFHHAATVTATGSRDAYFIDYRGTSQELLSAVKHGFLFQGQYSVWQKKRRGSPVLGVSPHRFVTFLQNHDQISNSLHGLRLHQTTSPALSRALTALLLLSPSLPMLFNGQEFGASTPFLYFADHKPELAEQVTKGRRAFLEQFRSVAAHDARGKLPSPHDEQTFLRCKLDFAERERNRATYRFHKDLLQLRHKHEAIHAPAHVDGAVLSEHAFLVRAFVPSREDLLLIVNFGAELHISPSPEPLLAPGDGGWSVLWSSEAPEYGGNGTPAIETTAGWLIPPKTTLLLSPHSNRELPRAKLSETD